MQAGVKASIREMRQAGMSFADIGRRTNLPVTTVKSFIYRDEAKREAKGWREPTCPQCGGLLPASRFRPRRFCSDECRSRYWTAHPNDVNRKSAITVVCCQCGSRFEDYSVRQRKYCSHACYIAARYGDQA